MAQHTPTLRGGAGSVPHFEVTTVDGTRVRYADIWQRRNLVFVALDRNGAAASREFARQLQQRAAEFARADTALVISEQPVEGLPSPGVAVADRWGEVIYTRNWGDRDASPVAVDELLEWITFVREQCPECPPD